MPPLPPVNKVIRVILTQLFGEDTNVQNRLYIAYQGSAPSPAQLNSYAVTIAGFWNSNLAAQFQAGLTLKRVDLEDLTSALGNIGSTTVNFSGTDTGVTLPGGMALVLQQKITRRYRGGHPRLYFAGISNAHLLTDQTWNSTYTAGFITAWNNFVTNVNANPPTGVGPTQFVNVSYFQGFTNVTFPSGRTRPVPSRRVTPLQDLIINYSVNPKVASQRRRNLQSR